MLASGERDAEPGRRPDWHFRYLWIGLGGSMRGGFGTLDEANRAVKKSWSGPGGYYKSEFEIVDTWNEPGQVVDDHPDHWMPYWKWEAA
jgi:hypothetical protein